MSQWIRYDNIRQIWEVSPNVSESVFSDLYENHPLESKFGRWIEFSAYQDARAPEAYDKLSLPKQRVQRRISEDTWRSGNYNHSLQTLRRRRGISEEWQGMHHSVTDPPLAPAGSGRLYFSQSANRLRLSENAGAWTNVAREDRAVSTQHSLTGGGDLTANRTLNLVNDSAAPGNFKYYSTNSGGTRGWNGIPYEAVRVYNSAAISVSSGIAATLTFNTERYKSDAGMHSNASNTERLIATVAGKYRVTGGVIWTNTALNERQLSIYHSDGTELARVETQVVSGNYFVSQVVTTDIDLALNEYVVLKAFQDSGGAINIVASSILTPSFMMHRMS